MSAPPPSPSVALPRTTFTTAAVPAARRTAVWQEHCERHLPGFRCSPLGSDDIRISWRRTLLPRFELIEVSGDGNLMERTPELIASAPTTTISLGILLRGSAFVQLRDRIEVLGTGDALLYDSRSPCAYGRSDGFAELVVNLSQDVFEDHGCMVTSSEPRVLRPDTERTAEFERRLGEVQSALSAGSTRDTASNAVDALLDLMLVHGRASTQWAAARDHVRQNLHDPTLGVPDVAVAAGVSERQLARVFAAHDTTVGRTILVERMRTARQLMSDPQRRALGIAQIAKLVGFLSPSHFSRAFRAANGISPSMFRDAVTSPSES